MKVIEKQFFTKPITKKETYEHGIATCDSTNVIEKEIDGKPVNFHLAPLVGKSKVRRIIKCLEKSGTRMQRAIKKRDSVTFSKPAKELIQTDHESTEIAEKEIETVVTSSHCPQIKELK